MGMLPCALQDWEAGAEGSSLVKSDIIFDCNETILKQQDILKREIQDCLQLLSKVKIWIQVCRPQRARARVRTADRGRKISLVRCLTPPCFTRKALLAFYYLPSPCSPCVLWLCP